MMKILNKHGIEGNFLTWIQCIYKKNPRANIILNGKILNVFPLRTGKRQGCLLTLLLLKIVLWTSLVVQWLRICLPMQGNMFEP